MGKYLQRPDSYLVQRVTNKVADLGIDIPFEHAELSVAALLDWLINSKEGVEYTTKLFGFNVEPGRSDKEYHLLDTNTSVSGDKISILTTCVVNGKFVPPNSIDVLEKEIKCCDICGTNAPKMWSYLT